jgi:hypothetical protein
MIIRVERDLVLRLGVGLGNTDSVPSINSQPPNGAAGGYGRDGALGVQNVVTDIPTGTFVHGFVDRPTTINGTITNEGEQSNGGFSGPHATYQFEQAELPPLAYFDGVPFRGLNRVLIPTGLGPMRKFQAVPAWAVLSPVQNGSLVQKGHKEHFFQLPGGDTSAANRYLLRWRWTATPVVAGTWITGDGTTVAFSFTLPNQNIAPGSFVSSSITIAGFALVVSDDGNGQLVGYTVDANNNVVDYVYGYIDYVGGKGTITFSTAPPAGAITASYEQGCTYQPIDAHLEWDAEMAN